MCPNIQALANHIKFDKCGYGVGAQQAADKEIAAITRRARKRSRRDLENDDSVAPGVTQEAVPAPLPQPQAAMIQQPHIPYTPPQPQQAAIPPQPQQAGQYQSIHQPNNMPYASPLNPVRRARLQQQQIHNYHQGRTSPAIGTNLLLQPTSCSSITRNNVDAQHSNQQHATNTESTPPTPATTTRLTQEQHKYIDNLVGRWIILQNHEFDLVEEPEFIKLINYLWPAYEVPGRKTVCNRLL